MAETIAGIKIPDSKMAKDLTELIRDSACRIRKIIEGGYRSPQPEWPKIHDTLVDSMIRLDKSMRPFVQTLKK